jgi:hypothetical protein
VDEVPDGVLIVDVAHPLSLGRRKV